MPKVRTAIIAGVGVPLLMFLSWDAAILGSLGSLQVCSSVLQFLPAPTLVDECAVHKQTSSWFVRAGR